jgi:hypothetical protein
VPLENETFVAREELDDAEFRRRERHDPTARRDAARAEVDDEFAEDELLRRRNAGATAERAQPCGKFFFVKRFDEIVVGAGIEAAHAIGDAVAGGEYEDWDVDARAARALADGEPIEPGQNDVDDGEIEAAVAEQRESGVPFSARTTA